MLERLAPDGRLTPLPEQNGLTNASRLHPLGVGSAHAGMTLHEVEDATGTPLEVSEFDTFGGHCYYAQPEGVSAYSFQVFAPGDQPPADPHTGTFLALSDDGEMAFLAGFGDLTGDFFGPRPTSPNPPPGGPAPRVSLEGRHAPDTSSRHRLRQPARRGDPRRQLRRLDNRGSLPHTLVNDDLGVDLAAEPGQRATATVQLPPGEHVFYCRIGNHREAGMELHLTAE